MPGNGKNGPNWRLKMNRKAQCDNRSFTGSSGEVFTFFGAIFEQNQENKKVLGEDFCVCVSEMSMNATLTQWSDCLSLAGKSEIQWRLVECESEKIAPRELMRHNYFGVRWGFGGR